MNPEDHNWKTAFGATAECADIEELVVLLEGRRGDGERTKANAHLATCAHCQ